MTNIDTILIIIKEKIVSYESEDVYNMDEMDLFYNLAPSTIISHRQIEGVKKDKTCLTIAFTCNADDSDRLPSLFIDHTAKPRCFNKKTDEEFNFQYLHNTKAWMTAVFFLNFIKQFNKHVNKRRVLLLLDNAPNHVWINNIKEDYPNIDIIFLPPNTISKLQPMDADIIATFKYHYHKYQLQHAVDMIDHGKAPYKIDQLKAMRWSCMIWRNMETSILTNYWRHIMLLTVNDVNMESIVNVSQDDTDVEFAILLQNLNIQDEMTFDEYINIPEEDESHEILTDEQLFEIAQTIEEDKEQKEAVRRSESAFIFSKQESIRSLAKAIAILESSDVMQGDWDSGTEQLIIDLRKKQSALRREMLLERDQNMTQKSITRFFNGS